MKYLVLMLTILYMGYVPRSVIASTIVPPAHYGEMVRLSDAVIKAEVISTELHPFGGLIYTKASVIVRDVLKGDISADAVLDVFYLGGISDELSAIVPGTPRLEGGDIMLLSIKKSDIGWSLWLLSYGQLKLVDLADGTKVFRALDQADMIDFERKDDAVIELPGVYRANLIEQHIRAVVTYELEWDAHHAGSLQMAPIEPETSKATSNGIQLPAGCSMLDAGNSYGRWKDLGGSTSLRIFTQNEASSADRDAIAQSVNNWGSIAGTSLSALAYGGQKPLPACDAGGIMNPLRNQVLGENELFVTFNDPCGNLEPTVNCVGILATAQHYVSNQTHVHRGQTWSNLSKGVVIVNKGIQSCLSPARFLQTIQHEIGHLLGFGHHTIEPANMNAACCNPLTAKDIACAQYVYSSMALNPTPVIARITPDVVPQGTTLTVTVEGIGFMPESVVAIGGSDIQIQSVQYKHENKIDVTVVVLRAAIPSSRAFRVTNPIPGGGRSQDMAFTITASTGIPERDEDGVPYTFRIGQNFPNPFNPSTIIPYEIPWQTWVTMDLLDSSGKLVMRLIDSEVRPGRHQVKLEADGLTSGVYLVRLQTDVGVEISKITLSK